MLFSAFTPLGLYRLSGAEPTAKRVYQSLVSQYGSEFSTEEGTRQQAFCYATSMAIARAAERQEEAALQNLVSRVSDLLPLREKEYGLVPGHDQTTYERKQEFARAKRLPPRWTKTTIEAALRELIGDGFYAYWPVPLAQVTRFPATITSNSPMNLQRPDVARKIIQVLEPITLPGAVLTIRYKLVSGPLDPLNKTTVDLVPGDRIVIEPNIPGISEVVVVEAVGTAGDGTSTFEGQPEMPHTDGCLAFTHPYPAWTSTKRHSLIIVTPAIAQSQAWRRRIDRAMRRMARAASTWAIVQSSDGVTTDVFKTGLPGPSCTTLEPITF